MHTVCILGSYSTTHNHINTNQVTHRLIQWHPSMLSTATYRSERISKPRNQKNHSQMALGASSSANTAKSTSRFSQVRKFWDPRGQTRGHPGITNLSPHVSGRADQLLVEQDCALQPVQVHCKATKRCTERVKVSQTCSTARVNHLPILW